MTRRYVRFLGLGALAALMVVGCAVGWVVEGLRRYSDAEQPL